MILTAWRIVKAKHARDAFTGRGAWQCGGRWNSPHTHMVYLSSTAALAQLEMLAHLQSQQLLASYVLCQAQFDDGLVIRVKPSGLPKNWRTYPAPPELQRIGDEWVRKMQSAVLEVPSALSPEDCNYLINPLHKHFAKITTGQFRPLTFDPRLAK